ncbi:MAG: 2-hydroxyglutaryl-CoA dehydratase [Armatimonadetes bacterium]|nr:2-hydroxyglutaryl-CoA dehydratase [Armatimonadota bacterium]
MRHVGGLDIGSVATKAVVCSAADLAVLGSAVVPTGWRPLQSARQALAHACAEASISTAELPALGVTGYGRDLLPEATAKATEVFCQARAVHLLVPQARTIIDIGGQDSKVIRVSADGLPVDFALNDRCAAGTGRFLEVMAAALGLSLDELGPVAAAAAKPCPISSTCTVFAESEVVALLSRGEDRSCVAAGLCHAIARQLLALGAQIGIEKPVALVGGVAKNEGVRRALADQLGEPPLVPDHPQLTAAIGAAIVALDAAADAQTVE